ncbi:MAG: dioxygenase [Rickettsiaceae bacterium]|nr:dioxygenase [Rickettsiaceae bacterium]
MYIRNSLLILVLSFITQTVYGAKNNLNTCVAWEEKLNDFEPEKFPKTNNLLRKPGQIPISCGKRVVVKGKLVDENCVPISDAKVFIWHVGCDGQYPYTPLRNKAQKLVKQPPKSSNTFLGAGTTTTNNKGEFFFITIIPPATKNGPSSAQLRFTHHRLGKFETQLNFNSSTDTTESEEFASYDSSLAKGSLVREFKIVAPWEQKLKSF